MKREPRPSDVFHIPQPNDTKEQAPPYRPCAPDGRRRLLTGVLLAGSVAAAGLLGSHGTPAPPVPPQSWQATPADDEADDAPALALTLFLAETSTLRKLDDVELLPDPAAAARAANGAGAAVHVALRTAQAQYLPDALAADYWYDPAHEAMVALLVHLEDFARQGAVLQAAEHAHTRRGELQAARLDDLVGSSDPSIRRWARALRDHGPSTVDTAAARARASRRWRNLTGALTLPATAQLRAYLSQLPPKAVTRLRRSELLRHALNRFDAQPFPGQDA